MWDKSIGSLKTALACFASVFKSISLFSSGCMLNCEHVITFVPEIIIMKDRIYIYQIYEYIIFFKERTIDRSSMSYEKDLSNGST